MKKQASSLFSQIRTNQLADLTSLVNEKLSIDLSRFKGKTYATVDLWNIQGQGKTRVHRKLVA